jgi:hypothetical protein
MTEKGVKKKVNQEERKILYTFKRSRKAFLLEYACGLFLLTFLLVIYVKGIHLKPVINYSILGFGLFSIVSVEFSRLMLKYKIMDDKLVTIHGLIQENRKNIYFHPLGFVPDINTHQSRIQRLLNYGTISIVMGGSNFEIKDVNNPHSIIDIIEEQIEYSKHPERKRE